MYITDQCLTKVHMYLDVPDQRVGDDAVVSIQKMFDQHIISVTFDHVKKARLSPVKNFESSVEIACAIELMCDAIITNQIKNFENFMLSVWSIEELELRLKLEQKMKPISFNFTEELSIYLIHATHKIRVETAEFLLLKSKELQEKTDKILDDFLNGMEVKLKKVESMNNSKLREIQIAQIDKDIDNFMALQQGLIAKFQSMINDVENS
jgi:hypothetical protein